MIVFEYHFKFRLEQSHLHSVQLVSVLKHEHLPLPTDTARAGEYILAPRDART